MSLRNIWICLLLGLSLIIPQFKSVAAIEPAAASQTNAMAFNTQDRLIQHPQNPLIMYLYEEGEDGDTGLLKSTDGGATWQYLSITGHSYTIEYVELDPTNPMIMYVVSGRHLYRSTDGGITWIQLLDQEVYGYGGSAFALNQHSPNQLFVRGDVPNTLNVSVDHGTTWQSLSTPTTFSAVFVDPYNPRMLYGKHQTGIYTSSDHGLTWTAPSTLVAPESTMIFDPHHPGTIYAVMPWTIYKTSDSAQTWTTFFTSAPYEVIVDFSLDPQTPDTLYFSYYNGYACTHLCGLRSEQSTSARSQSLISQMVPPHGLSKSTDGGIMWSAISPNAGTKYEAFALHPRDSSRLYAVQNSSSTTPQQAWTSSDGGTTWSQIQCDDQILDIYPDAANPAVAYLSKRDGLHKTTDHGATCTPLTANRLMADVEDVVVDPYNPDLIYALTAYGGVMKSSDRGQTWAAHNQGIRMDVGKFNRLVIDPTQPTTLYVIKNYESLYKSTNAGATWVESVFPTTYLKKLVIDPVDSNILYLLQGSATASTILKSTDAGQTWNPWKIYDGPISAVQLMIAPTSPKTYYLIEGSTSFYRISTSQDEGITWSSNLIVEPSPFSPLHTATIAVHPLQPSTVYAGFDRSVYKTSDDGATWYQETFPSLTVTRFAFDPQKSATVYAATNAGLYVSLNEGATWEALELADHWPSNTVALDPLQSSRVYLGTQGHGIASLDVSLPLDGYAGLVIADPSLATGLYALMERGGLYHSADRGQTWTPRNAGLPIDGSLKFKQLIPSSASVFYLTTVSHQLYRSVDSGLTWSLVSIPAVETLGTVVADSSNPDQLYAVMTPTQGVADVYSSADAGVTWTATGLVSPTIPTDIAVHPLTPTLLYAATTNGLYTSANQGQTWEVGNTGIPTTTALYDIDLDPVHHQRIYATGATASYRSIDGGATWHPTNFPTQKGQLYELTLDPQNSLRAYAATNRGLFASSDGGVTWQSKNTQWRTQLKSVLFDPLDPTRLYLGTAGRGVVNIRFSSIAIPLMLK